VAKTFINRNKKGLTPFANIAVKGQKPVDQQITAKSSKENKLCDFGALRD